MGPRKPAKRVSTVFVRSVKLIKLGDEKSPSASRRRQCCHVIVRGWRAGRGGGGWLGGGTTKNKSEKKGRRGEGGRRGQGWSKTTEEGNKGQFKEGRKQPRKETKKQGRGTRVRL